MLLLLPLLLHISFGEEYFSIQLSNNSTLIETFAKEHGLKHVRNVAGFEIFKNEGEKSKRIVIEGLYKDIKRKHTKKGYHNLKDIDPLYMYQWHLHDNLFSVDCTEDSGKGVNIAIVDDGIQHTHPDISNNYSPTLSWDFNDNDADPAPSHDDGHGTCCAGVAAAGRNNICGRGVAHEASIVGIRLIGKGVYDWQEAQALMHHNDVIRIYSNSWGPNG